MNKPPRKHNKDTSLPHLPIQHQQLTGANEDISQELDPPSATIIVTAVEVPELTEQKQSDKPDGIATLTACMTPYQQQHLGQFMAVLTTLARP